LTGLHDLVYLAHMNTTNRLYSITKINDSFILTGKRGAMYVLVPAYWDDAVTMKAVGGRNFGTILRDSRGQEAHFNLDAVKNAFYLGLDIESF
jgi:hypothetical protein